MSDPECDHTGGLKRRLVLWYSAEPLYEVVCERCHWWGGLVREGSKRVVPGRNDAVLE